MTPIFINMTINGDKKVIKRMVGLTQYFDAWQFMYVNGETDEDIYSDNAWDTKQDAIDAATNSENSPINFTDSGESE